MHCGLQKIGNDSSKVSEAGKEVSEPGKDVSTSYQQRNKSTSLEITKVNYSYIFAMDFSIV